MIGTILDVFWLFAAFLGITMCTFYTKEFSHFEFLVTIMIWYIGGQWILDRRAKVLQAELDEESVTLTDKEWEELQQIIKNRKK